MIPKLTKDLVEEYTRREEYNELTRNARDSIMDAIARELDPGSSKLIPEGISEARWDELERMVFTQIKGVVDTITAEALERIHAAERESLHAVTKAMDALSAATLAMVGREGDDG